MNIFMSWSGSKSHQVAEALRHWLPFVFQSVRPWVSSDGVHAGSRWGLELARILDESDFGILCVTRENLAAPWLLFEAGALSKSLEYGKVVPYLVDVGPADLTGPLAQFQAVSADKEGTRRLVRTISMNHPANHRPDHVLDSLFDLMWPRLQGDLEQLTGVKPPRKSVELGSPRGEGRDRPPQSKTTEAAFLESCSGWARSFFAEVFQAASDRGLTVSWGTKGFSIRVRRPSGEWISILYGYPPGSMSVESPSLEIYLKYLVSADTPNALRASLTTPGGFHHSGKHTLRLPLSEATLPTARASLPLVWFAYERIGKTPADNAPEA